MIYQIPATNEGFSAFLTLFQMLEVWETIEIAIFLFG